MGRQAKGQAQEGNAVSSSSCNDDSNDDPQVAFVLIGDSDIDHWPAALYPQPAASFHCKAAQSGATLHECIALVKPALAQARTSTMRHVIVVACAGENDIAQSYTAQESGAALTQFLTAILENDCAPQQQQQQQQDCPWHVIFLGPKLEPWLQDDKESRRAYIRLSKSLQQSCAQHERAAQVTFLDCLLQFCGNNAHKLKGALLGGKAVAQRQYFASDLLHLNDAGYRVWKQAVEECMATILLQHRQNESDKKHKDGIVMVV